MAKTARTFSFAPVFVPTVPATLFAAKASQRAPNDNAHPFETAFFAPSADKVKTTGEAAILFVPTAYWTEAREIPADKCTPNYMEAKLRDQFNKWRDRTKVITTPRQREPNTVDKAGKIISFGKVTVEEVSENKERGMFVFRTAPVTGKEDKMVFPEGVKPEAGVMCSLELDETAKAALEAAKAAQKEAA
jgi:hypothetical protein